jgi:hypothetical protein
VVAELDAGGDAFADFRQDGEGLGAGVYRAGLVIALPGQHLLTDIPLQREAVVGDHGGDGCDLAEQMVGQRGQQPCTVGRDHVVVDRRDRRR